MKHKVQVWVYFRDQGGKFYFLLLLTTPERGAFWQPITGGVEAPETLEEAALREVREETGLIFARNPIPVQKSFEFESRGVHCFESGFFIQAESQSGKLPFVQLDPSEHTAYRWVLAKDALKWVRHASNARMLRFVLQHLSSL